MWRCVLYHEIELQATESHDVKDCHGGPGRINRQRMVPVGDEVRTVAQIGGLDRDDFHQGATLELTRHNERASCVACARISGMAVVSHDSPLRRRSHQP